MFSRSLFKQSWKANRIMWSVITFAVCFMLACVMLIAGGSAVGTTKDSIQNTIIQGEMDSALKQRALRYYEAAYGALTYFDGAYEKEYEAATKTARYRLLALISQENARQYATGIAYRNAATALQSHLTDQLKAQGYDENSVEAQEFAAIILYTFNPMTQDDNGDIVYQFDDFYTNLGETPPRYDLTAVSDADRDEYRGQYVFTNTTIFFAGSMVNEENVDLIMQALSGYGVTRELLDEFGYSDYNTVRELARYATATYRANLAYRLANIQDGESEESIKEELFGKVTVSLLSSLPQEVAGALEEVGGMDLYGALVGTIFYKMSGLLLPIIYMIMTANALIAGQVDSGSMAYILSTSTKRSQVTFTQAMFLIGTLLVMFLCTTVTSLVCFVFVEIGTALTYGKLLQLNLGAFFVMFAMSGICFFTSCFFNRSKHSMGIGGGLTMFFLVAVMLGLFGSATLPSIVRMPALDVFNYVTLISLFDVASVLDGTVAFWWKSAVLVVVGVVFYAVGSAKFKKKDLPL